MSVIINTNYSATVAANNLASSNSMLQRSLNRLSSGSRIVNPADDAGGLAVSMKLAAAAKRSGAVNNNIANSVSLLQTQDGVLKVAGKLLERISELKTLYSDPTKNTSDLANYDTEFVALKTELTALSSEKFNGVSLFGSAAGVTVNVVEDASTNGNVALASRDLVSTSSGFGLVTAATSLADVAATTSTGGFSLTAITGALQNIATMRAANGSEQSRLGFASELITTNKANLEAANSRISDVDVAEESTQLARWNTLVQAGTAMLAQANSSANSVLKLLQ
jgi:flagellin